MAAKIENPEAVEPSDATTPDESSDAIATSEVVQPVEPAPQVAEVQPEPAQAATPPEAAPRPSETHNHVAIRDFAARFAHQILHFKAGEIIEARIGHALRAAGSPIKLVEKSAEETQGKL